MSSQCHRHTRPTLNDVDLFVSSESAQSAVGNLVLSTKSILIASSLRSLFSRPSESVSNVSIGMK